MCPNKGKKKVPKLKTPKEEEVTYPTFLSNTCCVPRGHVHCNSPDILDKSSAIHFLCSNPDCPQSGLMHQQCYEKFESLSVLFLSKHAVCRDWSQSQKLSSLWINRGWRLIFKMCACECGHGHIRRDLEFLEAGHEGVEQVVVNQPEQEKKKKRKSEDKVKPKLNCRMDKVSEKSVGNFSYNKHSKTTAAKKSRKLSSVNSETEEDSSIPGLQPSMLSGCTLKLDLSLLNAKLKVKKAKKLPPDPAKPAHDEDDGWTTVLKSSSRSGKRISENHAMAHIGDIATDVFQSEDDCCNDLPHSDLCQPWASACTFVCSGQKKVLLVSKSSSEDDSSQVKIVAEKETMKFNESKNEEPKDMLGRLVEDNLMEEISFKIAEEKLKCLESDNEVRQLQLTINFLHQSNMELREVAEARDVALQMQIDELNDVLTAEIRAKEEVFEQNFYLNSLIKLDKDSQAMKAAEMEEERARFKENVVDAAEIVKTHDKIASQMLEHEKMKMLLSVDAMEERMKSLTDNVSRSEENIKQIFARKSEEEGNLVAKKVKHHLESETSSQSDEVKRVLEIVLEVLKSSKSPHLVSNIFQQILSEVDGGHVFEGYVCNVFDEDKANSQHRFGSSNSGFSPSDLLVEMVQTVRDEARHSNKRVEMLESSVETLQMKNTVLERNMARKNDTVTVGSWCDVLKEMKKNVSEFSTGYDGVGGIYKAMASEQNITEQQIDALNDSVDQQTFDNKMFKIDLARMKEKLESLEDGMKNEGRERQTWEACNWL